MNAAFVHLTLNHVPVLGVVFALALLAAALRRRNDTLLRAGWVTLVVVALVALPVYFTGEGAEDIVKHEAGVTHETIKDHEEMALVALIGMEAAGLLALAGLVLSRRGGAPSWLGGASLVLALVVAGLMGATAERGGRIRHPEIHGSPQRTSMDSSFTGTSGATGVSSQAPRPSRPAVSLSRAAS